MVEKKKIGDLRREMLLNFNIDVPIEKVRDLEEAGCFTSSRDETTDFREYNESQVEQAIYTMMLVEIGVPIKDIASKNKYAIDARITSVAKVLTELNRKRGTNGNNNSAVDRREAKG